MQIRTLFAPRSLAALLLVSLICISSVTATSDHGKMRHPRQFPGGRGGNARVEENSAGGGRPAYAGGGSQAGRYNRPWHQRTWFSQLTRRFDEVSITPNREILTQEFLQAAESLPSFFDLLSNIAFNPARTDNAANIQKIRNRYNAAPASSGTLQALVRNEKSSGVTYSGSAAEALLWLTRTLDFGAQSLRKDLNNNNGVSPNDPNPRKPLSEAFSSAYSGTLSQYHNAYQRSLFSAAWWLVPYRQDFYRRLAAQDTSEAAVDDTDKWVAALEERVAILNDFLRKPEAKW